MLTQASDHIVGYAQKQYRQLDSIRRNANLPILKKTIPITGLFIHIISVDSGGQILIFGGSPQIVLAGNNPMQAYDYDHDALMDTPVAQSVTEELFSMFDGRIRLSGSRYAQYKQGWSQKDFASGTPLGSLNDFELSFFASGNAIQACYEDSFHNFGVPSPQGTLVPEFCGGYGSLFNATYRINSTPWNMLSTDVVYALNPINKKRIDSFYWTPSLFSVAPADPYGMFGGFYYGEYPGSQYGFVSNEYGWFQMPLSSATIQLMGFIDCRYPDGWYSYGYAEFVADVSYSGESGEDVIDHPRDMYIYAQSSPLSTEPNSYFYNESVYGSRSHASMTIGWEGKGKKALAKIKLPEEFSSLNGYPELDMWNFPRWYNTDSFTAQAPDAIGIVVSSGTNAILKRSGSYTTDVFETSAYHSHIRSQDGTLVAIFEGTGLIEKISVFDLHGKRDPKKLGEYTGGGYTEVRVSEKVSIVEAMFGEFIPFRTLKKSELEHAQEGIQILSTSMPDTSDLGDYINDALPSMAILSFAKDGLSSLGIKKCKIENGIATYKAGVDECFESTVVIDNPQETNDRSKLVSEWYVGGGLLGLVRGEFTGLGTAARFSGLSTGNTLSTITMPSTFQIFKSQYGGFVFENYFGEVVLGACLEMGEDVFGSPVPVLTEACAHNARCGEEVIITANADCGMTAKTTYSLEVEPLTISGDEDYTSGSTYGASGGAKPYVFSFPGTSVEELDEDSTGFTVDDTGGACGTINVTVTDHCGDTASFAARATGHWVLQSDGGSPYWTTAYIYAEEISGGSKVGKLYTPKGCICFPDMIYLSPAGSCYSYNPYSCDGEGDYWWGTSSTVFSDQNGCTILSAPTGRNAIPGLIAAYGGQGVSDSYCLTNAGNNYHYFGFKMYSHDPQYDKHYTWECS